MNKEQAEAATELVMLESEHQSLFDRLVSLMNAVGTGWILVIMLLVNLDVFSRYLFNYPISGVPLMVTMSIIGIVFLQLAAALRGGRLTRSAVFIEKLLAARPVAGHSLQAIYHLGGVTLMALIVTHTWPMFLKEFVRGTYDGIEGVFTLPVWPVKLLVLAGAAICGIQFVRCFLNDCKIIRERWREGERDFKGIYSSLGYTALICAVFYVIGVSFELSPAAVGLISVLFVLLLAHVGVHVGVALSLISFICVLIIRQDLEIAGRFVALAAGESLHRYEFGVIPLFVLMGLIVSVSGIGKDTYDVANHLFRRVRAGVGVATVGANAVFAAVTGTSIASASVFTKVAVPEMLRLGYKPRFAVGVVAGSSVLGMLIPPSLLLILFGVLSETSIGDLFLAGILPGIILALAYCALIWIMAKRFPNYVAREGALEEKREALMSPRELRAKSAPIVILIALVLGGIYGGVFTATEAGGVGALGAIILAALKRKLTQKNLWQALRETGYVTASICFLLIAAHLYSRMIAMSGIPNVMELFINDSGLGVAALIGIYLITIILLGTILDAGSIMLITVPLAVTALAPFDVSLVWFGIITIMAVEIGLLTPPLGLACFVINDNLQDKRITVNDVFWGAGPFVLTMLLVLIMIVLIPDIALALL